MRKITLFLLLASLLFSASIAKVLYKAGNPIVIRNGSQKGINKGFLLNEKDIIITDRFSKLRIVFIDKTVISIGKNSKFIITKYNYGRKSKEAFFTFSGAMKTVTGKIGKINPKKFNIKLKTATIGIRGTKFYIDTSRNTTAACIDGAITVRNPKTFAQKMRTKAFQKLYSEANDTVRDKMKQGQGSEIVVKKGQLTKIGSRGIASIPRAYSMAEIQLLGGLIGLSAGEMMFDLGIKSIAKGAVIKRATLKEQINKKKKVEKKDDKFKIHEL